MDVDRTLGSKEFQARAAATGNAWSPRVDRRADGTTSVDVLADLSRRRASTCLFIYTRQRATSATNMSYSTNIKISSKSINFGG